MQHELNGVTYPLTFKTATDRDMKIFHCGAELPDGNYLRNALGVPLDSKLRDSQVNAVLGEMNRMALLQYLTPTDDKMQ